MSRTPKVFISNKSPHDFRPAHRYGELVFVTTGDINKYAIGAMYRAFEEALKDSREDDFFLPTSLPILTSIGSGMLAYKHGRINYLLFRNGGYILRTVDFTNGDINVPTYSADQAGDRVS